MVLPALIALLIAQERAAVSAQASVGGEWAITRKDYIEFCSGNVITADLLTGRITASIGACDPQRQAPPAQVQRDIPPNLLVTLRASAQQVSRTRFVDDQCEHRLGVNNNSPILLSAPVGYVVDRGPLQATIPGHSPCYTESGKKMVRAFSDAVRSIHAPRLIW